jgi:hypothetical protein
MNRNQMKGFVRPKAEVLDDEALIPAKNLITPPPNQFTHEAIGPVPFFYDHWQKDKNSDGQFPAGTPLLLLVYTDRDYCRVADSRGLYVEVEYKGLKKLSRLVE